MITNFKIALFSVLLILTNNLYAQLELNVIGDQNQYINFVILPFEYHGNKTSPAIVIEDTLKQTLSSTYLFKTAFNTPMPNNPNNLLHWQLMGVRYVIKGEINEQNDNDGSNSTYLSIDVIDTLTTKSIYNKIAILDQSQIKMATQQLADHMYRRMFYTALSQISDNLETISDNDKLTLYYQYIIQHFKSQWDSKLSHGNCAVFIQQLPGGVIIDYDFDENCFENKGWAEEITALIQNIDPLPYEGFQSEFEKSLKLNFILPR